MPTTTSRFGLSKPSAGDAVSAFQGTIGTTLDTVDGVMLRYRGAWSAVTAYAVNDLVLSNGAIWLAKATSTNQVPPGAAWEPFGETPAGAQLKVDVEVAARVADVNAEEAARLAGDNALDGRVDVLEASVPTKASQAALDAETADRSGADTALDGRLDSVEATLPNKADLVGGLIPTGQIPAVALSTFLGAVTSEAAMLALVGQPGDWATRSDIPALAILSGADPTQLASWQLYTFGGAGGGIASVDGDAGPIVVLPGDGPAGTATKRTLGPGATQAAPGNDARLTDQRVPTDLSVTDAKVAAGAAIAESKLNLASDAAAGTASRRTLGPGATQAMPGNHPVATQDDLAAEATARDAADDALTAALASKVDLVGGFADPDQLASGTRDGTKVLRDDGTWAAVPEQSPYAVPASSLGVYTTRLSSGAGSNGADPLEQIDLHNADGLKAVSTNLDWALWEPADDGLFDGTHLSPSVYGAVPHPIDQLVREWAWDAETRQWIVMLFRVEAGSLSPAWLWDPNAIAGGVPVRGMVHYDGGEEVFVPAPGDPTYVDRYERLMQHVDDLLSEPVRVDGDLSGNPTGRYLRDFVFGVPVAGPTTLGTEMAIGVHDLVGTPDVHFSTTLGAMNRDAASFTLAADPGASWPTTGDPPLVRLGAGTKAYEAATFGNASTALTIHDGQLTAADTGSAVLGVPGITDGTTITVLTATTATLSAPTTAASTDANGHRIVLQAAVWTNESDHMGEYGFAQGFDDFLRAYTPTPGSLGFTPNGDGWDEDSAQAPTVLVSGGVGNIDFAATPPSAAQYTGVLSLNGPDAFTRGVMVLCFKASHGAGAPTPAGADTFSVGAIVLGADPLNFYECRLERASGTTRIRFFKRVAGVSTALGGGFVAVPNAEQLDTAGETWNIKVKVNPIAGGGIRLRATAWPDGGTIPTTWTIDVTDAATPFLSGYPGVRCQQSSGYASALNIDLVSLQMSPALGGPAYVTGTRVGTTVTVTNRDFSGTMATDLPAGAAVQLVKRKGIEAGGGVGSSTIRGRTGYRSEALTNFAEFRRGMGVQSMPELEDTYRDRWADCIDLHARTFHQQIGIAVAGGPMFADSRLHAIGLIEWAGNGGAIDAISGSHAAYDGDAPPGGYGDRVIAMTTDIAATMAPPAGVSWSPVEWDPPTRSALFLMTAKAAGCTIGTQLKSFQAMPAGDYLLSAVEEAMFNLLNMAFIESSYQRLTATGLIVGGDWAGDSYDVDGTTYTPDGAGGPTWTGASGTTQKEYLLEPGGLIDRMHPVAITPRSGYLAPLATATDPTKLPLTGGTLTGPLILPGNAVGALEAAPLQQVAALLGDVAADDLTDVAITAAAAGHVLRHNGTGFVNAPAILVKTLAQMAAIPAGTAPGQEYFVSDDNGGARWFDDGATYRKTLGLNAVLAGAPVLVRKTAESTRPNDTLADDIHLTWPILANQTLSCAGLLLAYGAENGDIQWLPTVPGGAAGTYHAIGASLAGAGGALITDMRAGAQIIGSGNTLKAGVTTLANTPGGIGIPIRMLIRNGATAGNVTIQWAQNTPSGTPTALMVDSFVEYRAV